MDNIYYLYHTHKQNRYTLGSICKLTTGLKNTLGMIKILFKNTTKKYLSLILQLGNLQRLRKLIFFQNSYFLKCVTNYIAKKNNTKKTKKLKISVG